MTPHYWRQSNYACPDCSDRLNMRSGPDHMSAYRCPECEWSRVFDAPTIEPGPVKVLERYSETAQKRTPEER